MQPRRQNGSTLIEVLIAMLILALAIVSAAAAHLAAVRMRQETAWMAAAVHLASHVADGMRANGRARDHLIGLDFDATRDRLDGAATACYGAVVCGHAELGAFEVSDIERAVTQHFPGGRIVVCRDAVAGAGVAEWGCAGGPGAPVAVKIGWTERGAASDAVSRPAVVLLTNAGAS